MKKYILFLNTAALMVAAAMMTSCGKDGPDTSKYTIYVTGQYSGISYYWINSKVIEVPDLEVNFLDPREIFVSNGDVYLAGLRNLSNMSGHYELAPSYWKNGVRTDLDMSGFTSGAARCIKVANGKVYTAGSVGGKCCYWVNNERTVITDYPVGSSYNTIIGLFVDGSDVYVCGREYFSSQACYWKNGVRTDMPESKSSASSIFVDNGKVYLAGEYEPANSDIEKTGYWVDGKFVEVDKDGLTTSIFVVNGTVYLGGRDASGAACYWKGSSKTILEKEGSVFDLYVKDGIVFTAGRRWKQVGQHIERYPCYWVNTKRVELPAPGLDERENNGAYGIFVE